jgi:putative Holliday junction resolvase
VKYLGIDYGTKRLGVAVSDPNGTIAFPRTTLPNDGGLMKALLDTVKNERIERIIVGDTRSHGGGSNPVTAEAEKFTEELARQTGLSVLRAFEVFSSIEASRYAPEGAVKDDAAAAAIILQRFLDMRGAKE